MGQVSLSEYMLQHLNNTECFLLASLFFFRCGAGVGASGRCARLPSVRVWMPGTPYSPNIGCGVASCPHGPVPNRAVVVWVLGVVCTLSMHGSFFYLSMLFFFVPLFPAFSFSLYYSIPSFPSLPPSHPYFSPNLFFPTSGPFH